MAPFLLLLLIGTMTLSVAFPVTGNYCGPDWCSNTRIDETECVKQGIWGGPTQNWPISCVDECCKTHDRECGSFSGSERAPFNARLAGCAARCAALNPLTYIPWPLKPVPSIELIIAGAMGAMSNRCCGSSCSSRQQVGDGNTTVEEVDDPEYTAAWRRAEEDVQDSLEAYVIGARDCFFGNASSGASNSCQARQKRHARKARQDIEQSIQELIEQMEKKEKEMMLFAAAQSTK